MTDFTENENPAASGIDPDIGLPYAFLEFQHHGAGAVHNIKAQPVCSTICGRRFAMRPYKHPGATWKGIQVFRRHSNETERAEPFELRFIVDNGAQRIQFLSPAFRQHILCFAYSTDNATAKT